MLELEIMINRLETAYKKEKSLRKKILLENAIASLREFERLDS